MISDPGVEATIKEFEPYAWLLASRFKVARGGGDELDVMQEAMIAAWLALPKYDGLGSRDGYVKRMMKLRVIDYVRFRRQVYADPNANSVQLDEGVGAGQDVTLQAVLEREELRIIVETVKGLPLWQRKRITDRLEGRTNVEIAAAEGRCVGTIDISFWKSKKVIAQALAA